MESANTLELRHFKETFSGVQQTLRKYAKIEIVLHDTSVMLSENGKILTHEQLWQLNDKIEQSLSRIELPRLAEWLEEVTQTTLLECGELLCESVRDFLDAGALCEVKIHPVADWNVAEWGCTVEEAGLLPAYTGFSCMFVERKITMPNFRFWTPDSEFVRYKLKVVGSKSVARLYRQMFINCLRAPCHELLHCVQQLCGQRMNAQVAEHDAYFGADVLARTVIPRLPHFYPGLAEELQLTALGAVLQKFEAPPPELASPLFEPAYTRWRDSFGGCGMHGLWNDNSFKTEFGTSAEFVAGQLLNTEASTLCPFGQERSFVEACVDVMFRSRNAATNSLAVDGRLDIGNLPVTVPAALCLEALPALCRFQQASAPVGHMQELLRGS